jgi:hypothetical protein
MSSILSEEFNEAIRQGDITWHAFPFNAEAEFMDQSLFQYGVSIAHDLVLDSSSNSLSLVNHSSIHLGTVAL